MNVYKAINAVQADLAKDGISKDRKNTMQGYNFRGIDDMYNALAPLLSKHGLCILPRTLSRECNERQSAKGGALLYVIVEMEFDFVCAEDGSKHSVKMYGEAMDSGDKATNKAMSAAYKYACMQAFSIPTEGDNDADAQTHQIAPVKQKADKPPKLFSPELATDSYMVDSKRADIIFDAAKKAVGHHLGGDDAMAWDEVSGITDNDEKQYLWAIIRDYSALRAALKKFATQPKEIA